MSFSSTTTRKDLQKSAPPSKETSWYSGVRPKKERAPSANDIFIHVDTLEPYGLSGPGRYVMTDVKKIVTSVDFDGLPTSVKKCQNQEHGRTCSMKKLIDGALEECKCLPAEIFQGVNNVQVVLYF